jgi:hypothetical protein
MKLLRHTDTVFDLVLTACVAIAFAALLLSCSRPVPDLGKVPRGQISRVVRYGDVECRAWLPLIVKSEVGQDYLAAALQAAQPWADAVGFAIAVPALDGEAPTASIEVDACPAEYAHGLTCARLAQTNGACANGVYKQTIQVFVTGDEAQLFYVLMHELGHVLGVNLGADDSGHSADEASIMFHAVNAPSLMEGPAGPEANFGDSPAQWVRDADVASLRRIWALK